MITEVEIRPESEATIEDDVGVTYEMDMEIIAYLSENYFHRLLAKEVEPATDSDEPTYILAFVEEENKMCVYSEVIRTPKMIKEYLEGAKDVEEAFLDLFRSGLQCPTYEAEVIEPEGKPEFS